MQESLSNEKWHWIALHLIPGLGNIACKNLLERFGHPGGIFQAGIKELREVRGVRESVAVKISNKAWSRDPEKELEKLEECGARVVTFTDPAYPPPLREIHDPPMLLYIRGKDIPLHGTSVAVVGSRNPTHYGVKAAEAIAQGLARRKITVVSGMARGIDASAHWGCIGGRGFTVAVMGTGMDRTYPVSNKKLFNRISESGTVVTEFPLNTPPEPKNFPIRNRIISGLSRGVVVVEATKKSGSLITASLALDQGREVFAVPGSIHSFKSAGCHHLIKQGARLVENADDVLDELGLNYPYAPKVDTFKEQPLPFLDDKEEAVYGVIGDYPSHIDQIARQSRLEPAVVSSVLMKLELKGVIRQLPGKVFVR